MKQIYKIIFEVVGTPVETDTILRRLKDELFIKKHLRPLKDDEVWQDVVYKNGTDEWISEKEK